MVPFVVFFAKVPMVLSLLHIKDHTSKEAFVSVPFNISMKASPIFICKKPSLHCTIHVHHFPNYIYRKASHFLVTFSMCEQ